MAKYEIVIPGVISPKGRPRFTTRSGFVRTYTDEKTRKTESHIGRCAIDQIGKILLAGALSVCIHVGLEIPKSKTKRWKADAAAGIIYPMTRRDIDNYAKACLDGLNGIAWADDGQVVDLRATKRYMEAPQTAITIETLQND
jgi:Holliday junction resolvase RusA-like endonuclease